MLFCSVMFVVCSRGIQCIMPGALQKGNDSTRRGDLKFSFSRMSAESFYPEHSLVPLCPTRTITEIFAAIRNQNSLKFSQKTFIFCGIFIWKDPFLNKAWNKGFWRIPALNQWNGESQDILDRRLSLRLWCPSTSEEHRLSGTPIAVLSF